LVLTVPRHERDTRHLVESLGTPDFTPPPDTADDLIRKFGVTREPPGEGSPDLAWLVARGGKAHRYSAGDLLPVGVEAFPGQQHSDVMLWVESVRAVISGDTVVDFGHGLRIDDWLRGGDSREQVVDVPLLELPLRVVLPTHGTPTDRAVLEATLG
jgi:glyoxylase-like metal-dependent hydrolase (beta-lactamase superfamily II)